MQVGKRRQWISSHSGKTSRRKISGNAFWRSNQIELRTLFPLFLAKRGWILDEPSHEMPDSLTASWCVCLTLWLVQWTMLTCADNIWQWAKVNKVETLAPDITWLSPKSSKSWVLSPGLWSSTRSVLDLGSCKLRGRLKPESNGIQIDFRLQGCISKTT